MVTARQVTVLTRILMGKKCSQVIAVAADIEDHAHNVLSLYSAQARLDHLTWVLDGRSGVLNGVVWQHRRMDRAPTPRPCGRCGRA